MKFDEVEWNKKPNRSQYNKFYQEQQKNAKKTRSFHLSRSALHMLNRTDRGDLPIQSYRHSRQTHGSAKSQPRRIRRIRKYKLHKSDDSLYTSVCDVINLHLFLVLRSHVRKTKTALITPGMCAESTKKASVATKGYSPSSLLRLPDLSSSQ